MHACGYVCGEEGTHTAMYFKAQNRKKSWSTPLSTANREKLGFTQLTCWQARPAFSQTDDTPATAALV